jgi:hypothetical protein
MVTEFQREQMMTAFAKAETSAILINANNQSAGEIPIANVSAFRVTAVQPKDGLLVIDIDDNRTLEASSRAIKKGPELSMVRVTSGQDRGGFSAQHLIIATPPGMTTLQLRDLFRTFGVPSKNLRFGSGGKTRAPLSVHRFGGFGELLEPTNVEDALEILNSAHSPMGERPIRLHNLATKRERPTILNPDLARLARLGQAAAPDRYQTRDGATFGFARRLAEQGFNYDDFLMLLSEPGNEIGDKFRERGGASDHRNLQMLQRTWANAVDQVGNAFPQADSDPYEHIIRVLNWRDSILGFVGRSSRTRGSDVACLQALADLFILHGTWHVRPGIRGLGSRMATTDEVARKALKRLANMGAISVVKTSSEERSLFSDQIVAQGHWLEGMQVFNSIDLTAGWQPEIEHPQLWLPMTHRCWAIAALGESSRLVYAVLTHCQMTKSEIAAVCGLSHPAVSTGIRRLEDASVQLGLDLVTSSTADQTVWVGKPLAEPLALAERISSDVLFASGGRLPVRRSESLDRRTARRDDYRDQERKTTALRREQAAASRLRRTG